MTELKKKVYEANMLLPKHNLVTFTWGNVSGIDREKNIVVIKPSGVEYNNLTPDDMVAVDMDGNLIDGGSLNPSSDTPTHLELYRRFPEIGGVVHTHSRWATVFSQMKQGIPPLGTTHADYFYGEIPCTETMTDEEIEGDYELNTGKAIVKVFEGINPNEIPAALVASHGPFSWGKNPYDAVHNAVVLEELAFMAWHVKVAVKDAVPMQTELLDRHYLRKHGSRAYYGQN